MHYDPLLQYEKTHIHAKHKKNIYVRGLKFLSLYLLLSSGIFSVLMTAMNFSAYSALVSNWINPDFLSSQKSTLESALLGSTIKVSAADLSESHEGIDTITQKITLTDPDMVYSKSYDADRLRSGISRDTGTAVNFDVTPYENRIIIPKLGKNIPLIDVDHDAGAKYSELQDIFMEELKNGIVRYPGTARPGEVGNAFIFGHSSNYPWIKSNYNEVFALIDTLTPGDEIIVYYSQKKYTYRVTDHTIVEPGDTDVLSSRDPNKKEISLMTCWPVGTSLKRYIIFGELIENQ